MMMNRTLVGREGNGLLNKPTGCRAYKYTTQIISPTTNQLTDSSIAKHDADDKQKLFKHIRNAP